MQDCPKNTEIGICYKCGSMAHKTDVCRKNVGASRHRLSASRVSNAYGRACASGLPLCDVLHLQGKGPSHALVPGQPPRPLPARYCSPCEDKEFLARRLTLDRAQGGSCKQCGSVEHLFVNCPERRAGKHAKIRLSMMSASGSADAHDDDFARGAASDDDDEGDDDEEEEDEEDETSLCVFGGGPGPCLTACPPGNGRLTLALPGFVVVGPWRRSGKCPSPRRRR